MRAPTIPTRWCWPHSRRNVDEGSNNTYTVVLASQPTASVTVSVTVPSGTDVSTDKTSLTFTTTTWNTAQTVTVSAAEDADAVADATVTLTHAVSGGDYGSVTADALDVTIIEADTPTLAIVDVQAGENVGNMVFSVTLSLASSNDVSVQYATSNGTAEAGTDYTSQSGTLTFSAGTTTTQQISVPITDDTVDEAEQETFTVTLSNATNAALAGGGTTLAVTGTINDNDDPAVTVEYSEAAYTATEGGTAATVQVQLDKDPERTVTIPLTHVGGAGTSAGDYSGVPASVTFNSGQIQQTFTVTATDDQVDDDGETVTLGLGITLPTGVTAGSQSTATVTLADDDARGVTIAPTALPVNEGASNTYTAVLTSQPTDDVTVGVTVPSGTDVSTDETSLTFTTTTWNTAQTVTVSAAQDADAVADATVTLTHAVSGGDYGSVTADAVEVTIIEADTPTLAIVDVQAGENVGTMVFEVTLSLASSNDISVQYATSDGTAEAGSDYTSQSGILTFSAGTTTAQQISVPITDDTVDEAEQETFTVTLSNATDAVLAGGGSTLAVTGTINDNDDPVVINPVVTDNDNDDPAVTVAYSAATYTATEGGTAATVRVQLDKDPERTVTIPLTHTPSTGASSSDYSGVPTSVTFNSGDTQRTFRVTATDDQVDDDGETVTLGLGITLPTRVTAGSQSTATVTLADDDERGVTVQPTSLDIDEGASGEYTMALVSQPTASVTVSVTVPSGTDVSVDNTSLTFTTTTWNTAQTVTVSVAQDSDAADDEVTLTHTASGGDYGSVIVDDVAVTVDDDEAVSEKVTLSVSLEEIAESSSGQTVTVTGTLDRRPFSTATTVTVSVSGGTAASTDFAAVSNFTLTIAANQQSGTATFTLSPVNDSIDEADETVSVNGTTSASGLTIEGTTITITDDDTRGVTVSPMELLPKTKERWNSRLP